MEDNKPVLIACKQLKPEFNDLQKIHITSTDFSIGRGLTNSVVIPFLSISRSHCKFKKDNENEWVLEDNSTFGIKINGNQVGKGSSRKLTVGDIITLEQTEEFVFQFSNDDDDFETPRKRRKMECANENILDDVKLKFEESQSYEIKHIEEKIENAKQMQINSKMLKKKLESDMSRKLKELESEFALQMENLKGEKDEVEKQKVLLLEERDCQLAAVKIEMEEKITELMDQIHKHNETESDLLKENSLLKEKLMKEREEFLSELNRENSSKQDMLEKLEARIREQEEVRLKEKEEFEVMLQRETEQLRIAKEKELRELEEQKKQREIELKQQLDEIQRSLQKQVEQTAHEKLKAEQLLNEQMEQMKKLSDEEKVKMEELVKEREEIKRKLSEAQMDASKSLEELRVRVTERETELAALAADRIQKQAEQTSEVINTLQEQLEKVKNQLQTVETEKNTILENLCAPENSTSESSKQHVLSEVGELMESELQCSICAELFVTATTLNCSHTFCKYCITMWKKKKKDCPICRAPITSECKSLVLDSFIEKMVQNLSEEMKLKRQDILKSREAEVTALMNPTPTPSSSRRRGRRRNTTTTTTNSTTTISTSATVTATTTAVPTVDLTSPTTSLPAQQVQLYRVQIPIDLTMSPTTSVRPRNLPMAQPVQIRQIQERRRSVVVTGVNAAPSRADQRPTTGATGVASNAAHAATGPPAAPSSNPHSNTSLATSSSDVAVLVPGGFYIEARELTPSNPPESSTNQATSNPLDLSDVPTWVPGGLYAPDNEVTEATASNPSESSTSQATSNTSVLSDNYVWLPGGYYARDEEVSEHSPASTALLVDHSYVSSRNLDSSSSSR